MLGPDDSDEALDRFHDECGVFGIYGHGEAANLTYLGIHALQHRGQESAGIAALDGTRLAVHRGMGLVADVFSAKDTLGKLPGSAAIGHTRYSTAGQSVLENAQPMVARLSPGQVAVAHNGNLVNAEELRAELAAEGALFQGSSDTEVLVHLIARERGGGTVERVQRALARVRGAWSLLCLTDEGLVAGRDPLGFRPLILGRLRGAWVFASETCALDLIEAEYIRELEPGELVVVDGSGLRTLRKQEPQRSGQCIFELIYFSRPDSTVFGRSALRDAKGAGPQAGARVPGRGGRGGAGARLGRARGARLRGRDRPPLRSRAHPQPLRGPHLHRAVAVDPPLRGQAEAEPGALGGARQARSRGRRFDRPRHHQPQDRSR